MQGRNAFVTIDVIGSANFENMCNEYKSMGYVLSSSSSRIMSESYNAQVRYIAVFVLSDEISGISNCNKSIKKIDIKLEIGKRYLISETIDGKFSIIELFEAFLDEISLSGKYIKLRYKISDVSTVDGWYSINSITIIEELFDR